VSYSENNQECAILAINTFLTDCKVPDYKIRALALRTLSSLRFSGVVTYIQQALSDGLKDPDPYVKKTAIIGCIKLYRQSPTSFKEGSDYVETLYKLLKDSDPQVVINSIVALNEILEEEGGIAVTRKLIIYLLNRIKEFNEWGLSIIIGLLARYDPKVDSEMLDILVIAYE
jgi:AP-4 complex subunit beta-1